jgi:signal transduction histidine kinase
VSAPADEIAALRSWVAGLQTACDEAQRSEAAMRLVIAGFRRELNGPLSVLVPRVDLLIQEAEEHELPLTVREDLAVLQRHLERLCRLEQQVVVAAAEPDRDGLVDLNAIGEPEGTGLGLSIIRGIVQSHRGTIERHTRGGNGTTWIISLPGRNGSQAAP